MAQKLFDLAHAHFPKDGLVARFNQYASKAELLQMRGVKRDSAIRLRDTGHTPTFATAQIAASLIGLFMAQVHRLTLRFLHWSSYRTGPWTS